MEIEHNYWGGNVVKRTFQVARTNYDVQCTQRPTCKDHCKLQSKFTIGPDQSQVQYTYESAMSATYSNYRDLFDNPGATNPSFTLVRESCTSLS